MIPGMMGDDERRDGPPVIKEEMELEPEKEILGLDTAVDDMFAAIDSKDKSAFKEALKAFLIMNTED